MNQTNIVNAVLTIVAILALGFFFHWGWNLFGH